MHQNAFGGRAPLESFPRSLDPLAALERGREEEELRRGKGKVEGDTEDEGEKGPNAQSIFLATPYRVGQIKRGELSFSLVCIYNI